MHLSSLALHKRILAGLKVATNADTTVENAYTIIQSNLPESARQRRKTGISSRLPVRRHKLHDGARFQSILAFLLAYMQVLIIYIQL